MSKAKTGITSDAWLSHIRRCSVCMSAQSPDGLCPAGRELYAGPQS